MSCEQSIPEVFINPLEVLTISYDFSTRPLNAGETLQTVQSVTIGFVDNSLYTGALLVPQGAIEIDGSQIYCTISEAQDSVDYLVNVLVLTNTGNERTASFIVHGRNYL